MRYDPYLPGAVAQTICDKPKYLASVQLSAFTGQDAVEDYFFIEEIEGYEIYLFVRWSPGAEEMTAALTAGRRHVRRIDTVEHDGKQPHLHYFDGTREMHSDVRPTPNEWNASDDLAVLLRGFAYSVNLTISEIAFTLDSQYVFQSDL